MAIYKEDFMDIDLSKGMLSRSFFNKIICEGDKNGDRFVVRVFRDGEPADMTGVSVVGLFNNPAGSTITLTGERTGNECSVILPEACYAVDGNFTLIIKIVKGDEISTVRVVDGTIINAVMDSYIDPTGSIPDADTMAALIAAAEAAAESIESISVTFQQITGTRYRGIVSTT